MIIGLCVRDSKLKNADIDSNYIDIYILPKASHMTNRRHILMTGAASIIVIGAGVFGARRLTSDLSVARKPWTVAGNDFEDPRMNALAYAILAPNPHNRQPWIADLRSDNALTVYCDLDRLLPETDPPNRQIVIGLGAFLEVLRQAAASQGYDIEVEQFPEGEPYPVLDERPVAHVTFNSNANTQSDPLFEHVLSRRTVRENFDQTLEVDAATLNQLGAVLHAAHGNFNWANDKESVETLKDICNRGWLVEVGVERTHQESTRLMRVGEKEINANPDGISLAGPVMEVGKLVGILEPEKLNDLNSRAYQETINFYSALIDSAMAFGWLTTDGNTRIDQLNVGAGWVRTHLAATKLGLAMHPLSQVLQEFPEMAGLYKEIHDFAGASNNQTVQGLFRYGYAKFPAPAPRWPLETRIADA